MSPLSITIVFTLWFSACGGELSLSVPQSAHQDISKQVTKQFSDDLCMKEDEGLCSPGFFCKDNQCICGRHPRRTIICNSPNSSSVLNCFCVTFDENTNSTLLGGCIYNCGSLTRKTGLNFLYTPLPRKKNRLNDICREMNRGGVLCGRCLPGHYPAAYSFNWTCITCPQSGWNWAKYIVAAYLPLTVFCVLILLFKVRLASSRLYAIVTFTQALALPVVCRVMLTNSFVEGSDRLLVLTLRLLLSWYGIWNLDFFRPFYSDFCLGIGTLPTLALDYAIAVYPLFLMVVCYILILLYDNNYRVVTLPWRPFHILLSRLRKNWNIRTSVVDAFATFFILSNVKFLSVSFDLLIPTEVYDLHLSYYNTSLSLYYAPDIQFLGPDHMPYAILAIFVLFLFVLLPVTVLALYPFRLFHKFLNRFQFRWYILHTFMDSFQGCYKDGTEPGTRDCRWFSTVYFLCRFLLYGVYAATRSVVFFTVAAITCMLLTLLIVAVRPFKSSPAQCYNLTHAVFVQLLALLCTITAALNMLAIYTPNSEIFNVFVGILLLAPLAYLKFLVLHWSWKRRQNFVRLVCKLALRRRGYSELTDPCEQEKLSDRIANPALYPAKNMASFSAQHTKGF